jgi:hypothetical protein
MPQTPKSLTAADMSTGPLLDPETREALRAWIKEDVHGWRYKAMLDYPPLWRLKILKEAKPLVGEPLP